jgi:hypothetical protein
LALQVNSLDYQINDLRRRQARHVDGFGSESIRSYCSGQEAAYIGARREIRARTIAIGVLTAVCRSKQ